MSFCLLQSSSLRWKHMTEQNLLSRHESEQKKKGLQPHIPLLGHAAYDLKAPHYALPLTVPPSPIRGILRTKPRETFHIQSIPDSF